MTNVVKFPKIKKRQKPCTRQRVFYIGHSYVGPMFCQDLESLYLKRKGRVDGIRRWSIITYRKLWENDSQLYSTELEECEDADVPEMLARFDIEKVVTFQELRNMGWNDDNTVSAEIIDFARELS